MTQNASCMVFLAPRERRWRTSSSERKIQDAVNQALLARSKGDPTLGAQGNLPPASRATEATSSSPSRPSPPPPSPPHPSPPKAETQDQHRKEGP